MNIISTFDKRLLRGDVFGGITADIVAVPLALAFGISSGLGAIYGLYGVRGNRLSGKWTDWAHDGLLESIVCSGCRTRNFKKSMRILKKLFDKNKNWANRIKESDPDFFTKLSKQQNPEYLWIGCSDSRVPANEIVGLMPGEIFVHRNIANMVVHTDLNCLSVIQFAVEVLKINHIIVCGHYGCGGIKAAMENSEHGLIDNWLRNIKDVRRYHQTRIDSIKNEKEKLDLMCELNVIEQVANVCHTTIVQNAWKSGHELAVHGWIYDIADGILKDLDVCRINSEEISHTHRLK